MTNERQSIPDALKGAVQILCASGETIPNIVGLLAFDSSACIIAHTQQEGPQRLLDICHRLNVKVLNGNAPSFVLDPFRFAANTNTAGRIVDYVLRETRPDTPILWNYNGGTKPMMLGLAQGMASLKGQRPYDALYVDTRQPRPLILGRAPDPLPLRQPMTVRELLIAQGIYWRDALVFGPRVGADGAPPDKLGDPTPWIQRQIDSKAAQFKPEDDLIQRPRPKRWSIGEWLTCHVACALLRSGHVNEIWFGTKVATSPELKPGTDQEVDMMFTKDNRLYVCECKLNKKENQYSVGGRTEVKVASPGDDILKIAKVSQIVGGRLAEAVFVCNKGLLSDPIKLKAEKQGVRAVPVPVHLISRLRTSPKQFLTDFGFDPRR